MSDFRCNIEEIYQHEDHLHVEEMQGYTFYLYHPSYFHPLSYT
jgi:hypothetical protein